MPQSEAVLVYVEWRTLSGRDATYVWRVDYGDKEDPEAMLDFLWAQWRSGDLEFRAMAHFGDECVFGGQRCATAGDTCCWEGNE